ncbi:hypothetical protein ANCCAN_13464 [Ancylostoma caninum]|uniref:Uncharacterized protein n=1 Tax=Ancylostoma caninum TaxID=29170 RepID=A0A368GBE2_ANCCA|nr:hypothetical protein ANCCAN_13464 [Ancylostoma caninum]
MMIVLWRKTLRLVQKYAGEADRQNDVIANSSTAHGRMRTIPVTNLLLKVWTLMYCTVSAVLPSIQGATHRSN